uniref:Uncharacterized protein n=1 Tax=Salix viminalis TaxID=40686 RepID=A0A6N2K335_SALVM
MANRGHRHTLLSLMLVVDLIFCFSLQTTILFLQCSPPPRLLSIFLSFSLLDCQYYYCCFFKLLYIFSSGLSLISSSRGIEWPTKLFLLNPCLLSSLSFMRILITLEL